MRTCGIVLESGELCGETAAPDAPLNLCAHHFLVADEWVTRDVGVTDVLPSSCLACGSRLGVKYPSGWLCAICEWKVGDIVDMEQAAVARVDVVYYLRFGDRIKIGTSSNPRQRLGSLRFDELLAFERGDRALEQRRHVQFAEQRFARTEWFAIHPTLLEHIDILRCGSTDPWLQYARWRSELLAHMS
jgi:hypothetical protein